MNFPPPPPALRRVLIALAVAYVVSMIALRTPLAPLIAAMALSPSAVLGGQVWRLLSYGLLHDGVMHLISNLLLLYFFAADIERQSGPKGLWRLLAVTTIGGGVAVTFASWTGLSGSAAVIGASGAALGTLVAWCSLHANRRIMLFGLLPLTGQQLLLLTVGIEVLMAVSPGSQSSAAHLGGMIAGYAMVTGLWQPRRIKQRLRLAKLRKEMRRKKAGLRVIDGGKAKPKDPWVH